MTEPYVFQIAVGVFTLMWLMAFYGTDEKPRSFAGALAVAIACGWVSALLAEGFGLFGMYAGPEPHM